MVTVNVKVLTDKPAAARADIVVTPVFAGRRLVSSLPPAAQQDLKASLRQLDFKGDWAAAELLTPPLTKRIKAPFAGLVGLGKEESAAKIAEGMRRGSGDIVRKAQQNNLSSLAVDLRNAKEKTSCLAAAAMEGVSLANYQFVEYSQRLRRQQKARRLRQLQLLVNPDCLPAVKEVVREEKPALSAVELARNLVNRPAEDITPASLVKQAQDLADRHPRIKLKVLDKNQAGRQGWNAFLAVARGSNNPPYVIHLTYSPFGAKSARAGAKLKRIFLVGKGITFDSGGLSLKSGEDMELMKSDMAGAATVLGVFSALGRLAPQVEVHGIIAACENMPSGTAYRPGDILTAKNGKTIEVVNTDAEGRVTLADALSYASEHKPDAIVDLATLTGACIVALGSTVGGLMGNHKQLQRQLMRSACRAGEGAASLPMPEEYRSWLDSPVADIRNVSSVKAGGAVTAALFLREFAGNTPWVHWDIAGPAYAERTVLPYHSQGGTGYGVRALLDFLKSFSAENQ